MGLHRRLHGVYQTARRVRDSLGHKTGIAARLKALRADPGLPAWAPERRAASVAFLAQHFGAYRDTRWHEYLDRARGQCDADVGFLPSDVFHGVLLPRLNPRERMAPYMDKNLHDRLGLHGLPPTLGRIVRGRLLGADYRPITVSALLERAGSDAYVFVKPSLGLVGGTGGGNSVQRVSPVALSALLDVLCRGEREWIIQRQVFQHPELARLHPTSINTLRVMTLRAGGRVQVMCTVVRIGSGGEVADNLDRGGVMCAVRDGRLCGLAYDGQGRGNAVHPDTGVTFDGVSLPALAAVEAICREYHDGFADMDLIAWDASVDRDGRPQILELNVRRPDVRILQRVAGPVFAPWLPELMATVRVRCWGSVLY